MLKMIYQLTLIVAVLATAAWVGYTEVTRVQMLEDITSASAQVDRTMLQIEAVKEAQAYAAPLVEMSTELSRTNMMFMEVVEQAKATVAAQTKELNQTREAMSTSMELMQEQIEENNRCVDHIRELENYIRQLMDKIPDDDCPPPPRALEEEETL